MESIRMGNYYHIYNRGAGKRNIFRCNRDFSEFIHKYYFYLFPAIQSFAWCLLNNHFHALIRVRTHVDQAALYRQMPEIYKTNELHGRLDPAIKPYNASQQLSHLMNSYTRYFNKKYNSSGKLIEGPLKRKRVIDENNFNNLICYIHRNPIHHGISKYYTDYRFSSYLDFLIEKNSFEEKESVLDRFGGKKNFIEAHEEFKMKNGKNSDFYLE